MSDTNVFERRATLTSLELQVVRQALKAAGGKLAKRHPDEVASVLRKVAEAIGPDGGDEAAPDQPVEGQPAEAPPAPPAADAVDGDAAGEPGQADGKGRKGGKR